MGIYIDNKSRLKQNLTFCLLSVRGKLLYTVCLETRCRLFRSEIPSMWASYLASLMLEKIMTDGKQLRVGKPSFIRSATDLIVAAKEETFVWKPK